MPARKYSSQNGKSVFMSMFKLDWSLKPLIIMMKYIGGINLTMHNSKVTKLNKVGLMKNILFIALAAFVIVSNTKINGSRILTHVHDGLLGTSSDVKIEFDSPFQNFFKDPQLVTKFVVSYAAISEFYYVPAIHCMFLVIVLLSSNWRELIKTFHDIDCRLKLTERFYRKCRRLGSFLMMILVLVNGIFRPKPTFYAFSL